MFYIYFCTRIPVSASEPRFSIISVHAICLLTDFHIYMCAVIIKFNSIQSILFGIEQNEIKPKWWGNQVSSACVVLQLYGLPRVTVLACVYTRN